VNNWGLIAGLMVTTAVVKATGPVALGGRQLPNWFSVVIRSIAPALLAALVVTSALANGDEWAIGADTAGVAVGGVFLLRDASVIVAVVVAAVVTAGLRAL
jgi:branched-subunit amino acid transport protein